MTHFPVNPSRSAAVILDQIGVSVHWLGDANTQVHAIAPFEEAGPGIFVFCTAEKSRHGVRGASTNGSVIVAEETRAEALAKAGAVIAVVDRPRYVYARCLALLFPNWDKPEGDAMAFADGWKGACVSDKAIMAGDAIIGAGSRLGPGVVVNRRVRLGANVKVQSASVLGALGLGFITRTDEETIYFPQLGGVEIGDGAWIGAGCVIHRGALQDTTIGPDTRIGSLTSIGHNTRIGGGCFIGPRTVISGGARIEDGCWIGTGAVIGDYVTVGASARVAPGAVVTRNIAAGRVVAGNPARVAAARQGSAT